MHISCGEIAGLVISFFGHYSVNILCILLNSELEVAIAPVLGREIVAPANRVTQDARRPRGRGPVWPKRVHFHIRLFFSWRLASRLLRVC